MLRPRMGQKKPPRLGNTICYSQELARKSHDTLQCDLLRPTARATKTRQPEKATKTRQYDLSRPNVGQKKPPRLGSTICYGQTWASQTRQYDLLRPRVGQKKPPRLGSTICYGQPWARKSHRDSAVRFVTAKRGREGATKSWQYDLLRQNWARKSHQDSAVRLVTAKSWPEGATKTRQYDLLRPNVGQKERKTRQYDLLRPRFVTAKRGPERASKTRQYDLLRPRVVQKEPPRLGSTICYGQTWPRKSHQDSAVPFVTAKSWPERTTKTRQYDLLRPNVGQKEPPKLGSTICYGQESAKRWPERATKTRQYDEI